MNQIFDYARKSEPEPVGMKKAVFKQFTESVLSCLEEADRRSFSIDKIIEVTNCTDIDQLEKYGFDTGGRDHQAVNRETKKKYSDSVFKIMQYMEARYAEPVTLDELGQSCPYEPELYFSSV